MEGLRNITLVCLLAVLCNATSTTKEVRTTGLSEKIIGGVIDLVQSHKNKPVNQPSYQQTYPNQGYPPYQQWNGQSNYQGQGYNYQGQYQNQGQYGNYQNGYQGASYPQNNGNFATGQVYPSPAGGFSSQAQTQGQYQIVYQNPPTGQTQYGQGGQYVNTQQSNQFQGQNQATGSFQGQTQPSGTFQGQTQPSGTFQGQTQPSGTFQGHTQPSGTFQPQPTQPTSTLPVQTQPTGSYQNQQTSNFQNGFQSQGVTQGTEPGSHNNQNFQVSGGHQAGGNAQGPTCVCQAWTKPSETLNDPTAEKNPKINNDLSM